MQVVFDAEVERRAPSTLGIPFVNAVIQPKESDRRRLFLLEPVVETEITLVILDQESCVYEVEDDQANG